ncbi:alpha/beta fold hydrolase [Reichenbachiella versicolor]|uniref:alpha/beta fold hydrolase n=1 Tax=Reichenbachiella versicolor TaxID=1821036 RepID=UPI000D6E636C|nr:alpha/beta fold hydrolase [Reichenbachiella versicolor]
MKTLIKLFFKTTSFLAPKIAGRLAFDLFQKPLNKKLRDKEKLFFNNAESFSIKFPLEDIECYELGPTDGDLVILVHGWESNAASMSAIAEQLAQDDFHVIIFNLPAHGYSKLTKTNLKMCKDALMAVINHINPMEPFSIVSHSFGSAVTSYTLANTSHTINQLVFLTTPNKLTDVFLEFGSFIGLNQKSQKRLNDLASGILGEPLESLQIEKLGQRAQFKKLTIIHDKHDKIISIEKARRVHHEITSSELIETENKGHYRMLWDQEVINLVSKALINDSKPQRSVIPETVNA